MWNAVIIKEKKKNIQLHIFLAQVERHGLSSLAHGIMGDQGNDEGYRLDFFTSISLQESDKPKKTLVNRGFEWENFTVKYDV
jgi:hypothetical protein